MKDGKRVMGADLNMKEKVRGNLRRASLKDIADTIYNSSLKFPLKRSQVASMTAPFKNEKDLHAVNQKSNWRKESQIKDT